MNLSKQLIFLIYLLILANGGIAQISEGYIGEKKLYYGVAYYPESWNFETVRQDIEQMKEANVNVVRMAEFSWNLMEPKEGEYDFEWLHKVVEQLHENGIAVILGTPTATPPAWLATKHPEIFRMQPDGTRKGHGARRNTSYTSKIYNEYSRKICEEMAKSLGKKEGVIAWQTDNEFHLSFDYSEESRTQWHQWLAKKYGTIENLNQIWATNLWSQKYDHFEQVPMDDNVTWHHSSLRMDWKRFTSDLVVAYQDIQLKAIRRYSDLPITHDGMPGQQINYPDLFENLDFMATNFYHNFTAYTRVYSNFDRMRGYNKGMHWVFETAPNHSGGGKKGNTWFIHQPKGSMRAIIWSNYALGGQGSLFWLWRQHRAGHEMPHGAFISAWGKPVANFSDLKLLGGELQTNADILFDNPVEKAEVGIYFSHASIMGLRIEETSNGINYYTDWAKRFYQPIADAMIHRDVIHESTPIDQYKVLVAPLMPVIPSATKEKLKAWVENGGTLIVGPMSGYRTEDWTVFTNHALGDFGKWTNIEVSTRLPIDAFNKKHDDILKVSYSDGLSNGLLTSECFLWSEALESKKGKVLASYTCGMQKGQPAIIESQVGKGKVVYLGTDPGTEVFQSMVMKYCKEKGIEPLGQADEKIVVVPRKGDKKKYLFVINTSNEERTVKLNSSLNKNILTGDSIGSKEIKLKPFEVILGEVKE